jgi:hypothetical protein
LTIYNTGANTLANPPANYLTEAETLIYFNTLVPASTNASALVKGVTKLSVAPASAINPIAFGQNDPTVVTTTAALTADALVVGDDGVKGVKTIPVTFDGSTLDASGFGVQAAGFNADTTNIANNGTIRLNKSDFIAWRNEANSGNVSLSKDSSDRIASTGGFAGALIGNVIGNVTGNLTGNVTGSSLTLGSGTALTKVVVYSSSLTPASVSANTSAEQDFTVSGLSTADKVCINGPAPLAGTGIVNVRVKATDTLSLTFMNTTSGSLTPTSGTYLVLAFRS